MAPPRAACSGSGSCGVAWQGPGTTTAINQTVFLQLYDDTGGPSSPEVELPAGDCVSGPGNPVVCRAAAGDFAVAWERYPAYGYGGVVGAQAQPPSLRSSSTTGTGAVSSSQRFDDAGNPVGSEFQANTYTIDTQHEPDIACDDAGDFVVVWTSEGDHDGRGTGVFGRRFTSSGAFAGTTEFQVNTYTTGDQDHPAVAADMDGDFVVAWHSRGISLQRFSSSGSPAGTEFQINVYTTNLPIMGQAVAADAAGNFVVVWTGIPITGLGIGDANIFAQRFSSDGDAAGKEFQVNEYTSGIQFFPSVTAAADGDFVVAWSDFQLSSLFDSRIQARQFDGAGTFLGTEFQVNTHTTSLQTYPALGIADDGQRLVVVWNSLGSEPTGKRSREPAAARVSPRGVPVDIPGPDGSVSGIFGQLYGPTNTPTLTPTITSTPTVSATPTETPAKAPAITGGDEPGSNEVTGTGPPNRDPDCLKVYEVGPNRVPDGGAPDDVLLGSGGTDANGNFTIMLSRPLKSGDIIFIVDTCAMPPTSGPLDLITGAAPAPALSPALLAVALAMLSLIALAGVRRRRRDP